MINREIEKLVSYACSKNLITEEDKDWAINRVLELLRLDEYTETGEVFQNVELESTLDAILNFAAEKGIINDTVTERDLFDTKLMGIFVGKPSEITKKFYNDYEKSHKTATDNFYKLCVDSNYIRDYRVKKDLKWVTATKYGDLDITVNLSKPEKDPKEIAAAKKTKQSGYPKCMLCKENIGYAGRLNFPARQNHRIIPVTINDSKWFLQYSPYVYYNEHCIVFNGEHTPMAINCATFKKLLDFVKQFEHYFVGSNADLPIVGGSILTHDHFQGGNYTFAMAKAKIEKIYTVKGYEDVEIGRVCWPMSVLRLRCENTDRLIALADKILTAWRGYTDQEAFIFSETDGEPHNTITPIARKADNKFELDLVLRNNITTKEHPLGVYHPHAELHHIKKENIGLIEVMGLAVLPSRLKNEINILADKILDGSDLRADETTAKHADWVDEFIKKYQTVNADNIMDILKSEIGLVFEKVLEHAGVFKRDEQGLSAFDRFVETLSL